MFRRLAARLTAVTASSQVFSTRCNPDSNTRLEDSNTRLEDFKRKLEESPELEQVIERLCEEHGSGLDFDFVQVTMSLHVRGVNFLPKPVREMHEQDLDEQDLDEQDLDEQDLDEVVQELNEAVQELNEAVQELNEAVQELNETIQELSEAVQELSEQELSEAVQELSEQELNEAVQELNQASHFNEDVIKSLMLDGVLFHIPI